MRDATLHKSSRTSAPWQPRTIFYHARAVLRYRLTHLSHQGPGLDLQQTSKQGTHVLRGRASGTLMQAALQPAVHSGNSGRTVSLAGRPGPAKLPQTRCQRVFRLYSHTAARVPCTHQLRRSARLRQLPCAGSKGLKVL